MSTYLAVFRTKMASWPCWTRSACGREPSRTRPSWTNWTPSVLITSTLRVASARIQSSSMTTACRTAASASSTTLARYWTLACVRNNEEFTDKTEMFVESYSAVKGMKKTINQSCMWLNKFLMCTQLNLVKKTKTKQRVKPLWMT